MPAAEVLRSVVLVLQLKLVKPTNVCLAAPVLLPLPRQIAARCAVRIQMAAGRSSHVLAQAAPPVN